jgi:hypothetical protein
MSMMLLQADLDRVAVFGFSSPQYNQPLLTGEASFPIVKIQNESLPNSGVNCLSALFPLSFRRFAKAETLFDTIPFESINESDRTRHPKANRPDFFLLNSLSRKIRLR